MSKKFGKFLFGTAVLGTVAAAAAYYYYQKKDEDSIVLDGEETEDGEEAPKRSYTSLDDITEAARRFGETAKTTAGKVQKSAKDAYAKVKDRFASGDDLDDLFEEFEDEEDDDDGDFTPLSETAKNVTDAAGDAAEDAEKTVEEFFDDSDKAEGTSEEVKGKNKK